MTASPTKEASHGTGQSLADAWGGFDRIYCISLAARTDRRHHARREFERVGLGGRVQFIIVEKHPTDSEAGIFESHMTCLRAGLAAGAQNILVFEDDILFRHFSPEIVRRAGDFVKSNADWHLFFLGCFVKSSRTTPFRSILRVRYRCTAHAYAVNRDFAQRLVETPWRGMAYDDLLCSLNDDRSFAIYPAIAYQSGSATDNDRMRAVDRIRRLLGGVRVLQRWNEFSSRHLMALIVGHVATVLLVILIVLHHIGR